MMANRMGRRMLSDVNIRVRYALLCNAMQCNAMQCNNVARNECDTLSIGYDGIGK